MFDRLKTYIEEKEIAQYAVGATIGTVIGVVLLKIWHDGYKTGFSSGVDYDLEKVNELIKNGQLLWGDLHPVVVDGVLVSGDTNWDPAKADPSLVNIRTAL